MTIEGSADASVSADPAGVEALERQIMALMDSFRRKQRERAAEFDGALQVAGYRTLVELVFVGPQGATQLAESLGFDKSVLSRQLHQLEQLGHVRRAENPSDRRATIISAAPEAIRRVQTLSMGHRDDFRAQLARWNVDDVRELARLLEQLTAP